MAYLNGTSGVSKDRTAAIKWLRQAAACEDEQYASGRDRARTELARIGASYVSTDDSDA
jgi:TPR repeat protein